MWSWFYQHHLLISHSVQVYLTAQEAISGLSPVCYQYCLSFLWSQDTHSDYNGFKGWFSASKTSNLLLFFIILEYLFFPCKLSAYFVQFLKDFNLNCIKFVWNLNELTFYIVSTKEHNIFPICLDIALALNMILKCGSYAQVLLLIWM